MGDLVGLAIELPVTEQRPRVAAHRTGVWVQFGLLFEQRVNQLFTRVFAGGGVELDLHALLLGLAHQREIRDRCVIAFQHGFEHRNDALLQMPGFFQAEIGGVEVEIQMHVFKRVVIADEDRHRRLFVAVVHGDDAGGGAAKLVVTVQAFERQRHVEQLPPPGLRQAQGAVEFGDGEALMAVAAAQLTAGGVHQLQ